MNSKTPHLGTWLAIGSPVIAELAAMSGFDWILMDLEHGCESEAAIPNQLRAIRGSNTRGIVRVGAPNTDLIARLLDWGANGIMVPHVQSAEEAESIVKAAYAPPRGERGFSRTVRAYDYGLRKPEENTSATKLIVQIETLVGVNHAQAIARVDGIDVLFVGPSDLQLDIKHRCNNAAEEYAKCLVAVVESAKASGKEAGILVRDLAEVQRHIELGFSYIAVDSDIAIIRTAYQRTLSTIRRESTGGGAALTTG